MIISLMLRFGAGKLSEHLNTNLFPQDWIIEQWQPSMICGERNGILQYCAGSFEEQFSFTRSELVMHGLYSSQWHKTNEREHSNRCRLFRHVSESQVFRASSYQRIGVRIFWGVTKWTEYAFGPKEKYTRILYKYMSHSKAILERHATRQHYSKT